MKAEDIRKYRDRTPFRPFDLELTSGTRVRVTHPENILVAKDLGVVRTPKDDAVLFTPEEVAAIHRILKGGNRSARNGK